MFLTSQKPETEEESKESVNVSKKAAWPKIALVSVAQQLKDLERQISASQEEELACGLKLSGLLSIVND